MAASDLQATRQPRLTRHPLSCASYLRQNASDVKRASFQLLQRKSPMHFMRPHVAKQKGRGQNIRLGFAEWTTCRTTSL